MRPYTHATHTNTHTHTCVCVSAGCQNLANLEVIASNYAKAQADNNKAIPTEWAAAGDWIASVRGDQTIYASASAMSPSNTQRYCSLRTVAYV